MNRRYLTLIGLASIASLAIAWRVIGIDLRPVLAPQGTVFAASFVGDKPRVQLRWFVESGSMPDGGFRIYRQEGSQPFARVSRQEVVASAKVRNSTPTAFRPIRIEPAVAPRQRLSSKAEFAALEAVSRQAIADQRGPVETRMMRASLANPTLAGYFGRIKEGKLPAGGAAQKKAKDEDEATRDARDEMMMVASLSPGAAADLGLTYMDTAVQIGKTYQYEVRGMLNGQEVSVGSASVTVGSDPKVDAPVVSKPVQTGQRARLPKPGATPGGSILLQAKIDLHIDLPAGYDETKKGPLRFLVSRKVGDGPFEQLNRNRLVVLTASETKDGKLAANLISYTDGGAPVDAKVVYRVQSVDLFERMSDPVDVDIETKNIATPSADGTVIARLVDPKVARPEVNVMWAPPLGISDGAPTSHISFSYTIERQDAEAQNAPWTPVAAVPVGNRTFAGLKVSDLCALRPEWDRFVRAFVGEEQYKATLDKDLAAWLATIGRGESQELAGSPTHGPSDFQGRTGALKQPPMPAAIWNLVDKDAPLDRYVRYRITPVLRSNSRSGVPFESEPIGVPTQVVPSSVTAIKLVDEEAPETTAQFDNIMKGPYSNAIRMQPEAGVFGSRGSLVGASSKASKANEIVNRRLKRSNPNARLNLTAAPTNYGRKVTLTWNEPSFTSKLTYRVLRAIGSGLVASSGGGGTLTSSLTSSPALSFASGQSRPGPGQIRPGARSAQRAPVRIGGLAREFRMDNLPPDDDFVLLGETSPGATSFVDLTTRGQAAVYYYKIVAVNRWGYAGASAVGKVKIKPSMPPSIPVLRAVSPTSDGKIVLKLDPGRVEEEVVTYEVYRTTIQAPPVSSGGPGGAGRPPSFRLPQHTLPAAIQVVRSTNDAGQVLLEDNGTNLGESYRYSVVATNSAGLKSESTAMVEGSPIRMSARPVTNVAASFDASGARVKITCTVPGGTQSLILERQKQGGTAGWIRITTTSATGATATLTDALLLPGAVYVYRIYAVDASGNVSEAASSGPVTVPD
ncbi:MAG: hypothetical protein HZC36_04405 [Armatimonadetes bacterium]|nr:hypothetical protein [Armatimonadota bacterium]